MVVSRLKKLLMLGVLISLFASHYSFCMEQDLCVKRQDIPTSNLSMHSFFDNTILYHLLGGMVLVAGAWGIYSLLQNLFSDDYATFLQWKRACDRLPMYHQMQPNQRRRYIHTALTKEEFERVMRLFVDAVRQSGFGQQQYWLNNIAPDRRFYGLAGVAKKLFVQKLVLSHNSKIAIHADVHGDIHSLNAFIADLAAQGYMRVGDPFYIQDPNFYIVFLGDYTDRGSYGAECLYTVMRLKAQNPNNVILLRGNHEDGAMNANNAYGGFCRELRAKFNYGLREVLDKLQGVYNLLLSAVFVGSGDAAHKDFALLCHGGLEPRFDPRPLLRDAEQNRYQWIDRLDASWINSAVLDDATMNRRVFSPLGVSGVGFMWSDFIVDDGIAMSEYVHGRGYRFGKPFVQELLRLCSTAQNALRVVFRGHQHNEAMIQAMLQNHGIYNAWSNNQWSGVAGETILLGQDDNVFTLNVSPCSVYGDRFGYTYDTYAVLRFAPRFTQWRVEPHNVTVFN